MLNFRENDYAEERKLAAAFLLPFDKKKESLSVFFFFFFSKKKLARDGAVRRGCYAAATNFASLKGTNKTTESKKRVQQKKRASFFNSSFWKIIELTRSIFYFLGFRI